MATFLDMSWFEAHSTCHREGQHSRELRAYIVTNKSHQKDVSLNIKVDLHEMLQWHQFDSKTSPRHNSSYHRQGM
jgi:hypothetical protein